MIRLLLSLIGFKWTCECYFKSRGTHSVNRSATTRTTWKHFFQYADVGYFSSKFQRSYKSKCSQWNWKSPSFRLPLLPWRRCRTCRTQWDVPVETLRGYLVLLKSNWFILFYFIFMRGGGMLGVICRFRYFRVGPFILEGMAGKIRKVSGKLL